MLATRENLHYLVDELPEDKLADAARHLEQLRGASDPDLRALAEAPFDDEPWAEEDEVSLKEALADIAAGRLASQAEARRRLLDDE
jgi:hypothetical protein